MSLMAENSLFYGDNLNILREHIANESIDLIYLDPPFNSNRNYNVIFKEESGIDSEAQLRAFEDTWHWDATAEQIYNTLLMQAPDHISKMIAALRDFIGTNQMMAYLVMMTIRLMELHRVLKPTGSLYLHCDPSASHYLKIVMDSIFEAKNFRNEIIWHYTGRRMESRYSFNSKHDVILFYSKADLATIRDYPKEPWTRDEYLTMKKQELHVDEDGQEWIWGHAGKGKSHAYRIYLDEVVQKGRAVDDVWDIPIINTSSKERLGYPTQKPLVLLERIIQASSNPGDVILDPFCGCGTAIAAAQKLGRKWIGIDITHLAITLQKYRLETMFPGVQFRVYGEPADVQGASQLAKQDRYQFQWWALSLIGARPLGSKEGSKEGKKGSDRGIDGVVAFIDDASGKAKRALVQVKSGHVNSSHIRDLVGTVQREQAAFGVFITLETPTRDMVREAISAGFYHSPGWNKDFPRIQIFTIDELLHNVEVQMPPQFGTFKQAQRVLQPRAKQPELDLSTG